MSGRWIWISEEKVTQLRGLAKRLISERNHLDPSYYLDVDAVRRDLAEDANLVSSLVDREEPE